MPLAAQIWRVDAMPNREADFAQISDALADASVRPGDTLYVAGSSVAYAGFRLTKRVVIIGPGYMLDENPGLQASVLQATISGAVEVDAGADGAVLEGLSFESRVRVEEAFDVVFRRCRVVARSVNIPLFTVHSGRVTIAQSYIANLGIRDNGAGLAINPGAEARVANSYLLGNGGTSAGIGNGLHAEGQTEVDHVIVQEGVRCSNCVITNSIFDTTDQSFQNSDITYSIFQATAPEGEGNRGGVSTGGLFLGTGSADGRWQLAVGSQARGAGKFGVDAGMFGGSEPYVLSGIPAIPTIYEFTAPTSASQDDGLRIQLKARANN